MQHLARVIFVTGTDTGVGKTVLSGLLLVYLRRHGVHALAMKPFCSGDRNDARLLATLQDGELCIEEINPVYFAEPLAPFAAAKRHGRPVKLAPVLESIRTVQRRCQWLIIEGIGGVLVPLTKKCTVADLIAKLQCETVVVARNRLGTLNHTLLSVEALSRRGVRKIKVVVMQPETPDRSSLSNPLILRQLLRPIPVYTIGFLGGRTNTATVLCRGLQKIEKKVAHLLR